MVKAELQNIGHEKSYRLIELGTVSLKLQRADKDPLQIYAATFKRCLVFVPSQ